MLLTEYIKTLPAEEKIRFEYCYLGRNGERIPDPKFIYEGPAGKFEAVMHPDTSVIGHLYATCGECNDFEKVQEDCTVVRYIDFR